MIHWSNSGTKLGITSHYVIRFKIYSRDGMCVPYYLGGQESETRLDEAMDLGENQRLLLN